MSIVHDLITGSTFLTSSPVANTTTTPTVIAAPGVGFTLRILAVALTGFPNNGAGADLFAAITANLLAPLMVQQGGSRHATFGFPEPGHAIGPNTACVLSVNSNLVSQNGVWSAVWYVAAV